MSVIVNLDVKHWLADLRGKDIAEAYAWSYKRYFQIVFVLYVSVHMVGL